MSRAVRRLAPRFCLILPLLAGCADQQSRGAGEPEPQRLTGRIWQLAEIGERAALRGSFATLIFEDAQRILGNASCNRFQGEATLTDRTIAIGPLATTRRACAAGLMSQEGRFLEALGRVAQWRIESGVLVLSDAEGNDLLRFTAA